MNEEKPDMADDVNDHLLDATAEAWEMAKDLHNFLDSLGGWYNLAKQKNPVIASALIKVYMDVDKALNLEKKR